MNEQLIREEICEIGKKVWSTGMVAANDGNISVRLDEDTVLCTPTGVSKGALTPESICAISLDGSKVQETDPWRISSEVKVHLRLYRANADVQAVVHAHPPFGTTYAIEGKGIVSKMMPENIIAMPEIPVAPYATPSTEELAEKIEPFVHTHSACLMEMHGALAWGPTLLAAYQAMERLEFTAKLTYLTRLAGIDRELPEDEVNKLVSMRAQYGL